MVTVRARNTSKLILGIVYSINNCTKVTAALWAKVKTNTRAEHQGSKVDQARSQDKTS